MDKDKPDIVEIFESLPPTRNSKLMSTASHRILSEITRARRRGGKRRYGAHARMVTRILDPFFLVIVGLSVFSVRLTKDSVRRIESPRMRTAERIGTAYLENEHFEGHRARDMVQDTGQTL